MSDRPENWEAAFDLIRTRGYERRDDRAPRRDYDDRPRTDRPRTDRPRGERGGRGRRDQAQVESTEAPATEQPTEAAAAPAPSREPTAESRMTVGNSSASARMSSRGWRSPLPPAMVLAP